MKSFLIFSITTEHLYICLSVFLSITYLSLLMEWGWGLNKNFLMHVFLFHEKRPLTNTEFLNYRESLF